MIGWTLTITVAGVEHSAVLKATDMVTWEQHYNLPWSSIISPQGREEWTFRLAWFALKRTGVPVVEFDEWLVDVESMVGVIPPAPKVGAGPLAPPVSAED